MVLPALETPIGPVPRIEDLNTEGLDIPKDKLAKLFEVNMGEWKDETKNIRKFLDRFGNRLPKELADEMKRLEESV